MKVKISKIIGFILLFLSFLFIFSASWALNTFGNVTVEEIVFTFMIPQDGMNMDTVYSYILESLLITILFSLLFYYVLLREYKREIKVNFNIGKFNISKVIYPFNNIVNYLLVLIIFIGSLYFSLDISLLFKFL